MISSVGTLRRNHMKIRIMLVDDEMDALKLLGMLLSDLEDIEIVGSYTNPHEALKDIDHLAVDAVFLHRADLARKLRVKHPKLQIVFITAYAEYAVEAFEIRSTDYLLKPVRKERLLEAISNIRSEERRVGKEGTARWREEYR